MNNKIKYLILALIVFLAVLGVFFILKNEEEKKEKTVEKENQAIVLNQVVTSSEDKVATSTDDIDTNDWLVYKNEEYGYSIKYPINWVIFINNGLEKQQVNNLKKGEKK